MKHAAIKRKRNDSLTNSRMMIMIALFLTITYGLLSLLPHPGQNPAASTQADFSVTTFNVRNFTTSGNAKTNLNLLEKLLYDTKSTLIGLQEIRDVRGLQNFVKKSFPQYHLVMSGCGGTGKQHLALMFEKSRFHFLSTEEDSDFNFSEGCDSGVRPGFVVKLNDTTSGINLAVLVLHLKARSSKSAIEKRHRQLALLPSKVKKLEKQNFQVIVIGDLNTTEYLSDNKHRQNFDAIIENAQLANVSEEVSCTSYWSGADRNDGIEEPSHLDHILVSKSFLDRFFHFETASLAHCQKAACQQVTPRDLGESYFQVSDHCPLVTKFFLP